MGIFQRLKITLINLGLAVGLTAQAQGTGTNPPGGAIQNPLKAEFSTVPAFIDGLLKIIVNIGSAVVVMFIIYTGFLFVKARGKPEELNQAKNAFVWTVIGAAIVLGAFVISRAIQGTVKGLEAGFQSGLFA